MLLRLNGGESRHAPVGVALDDASITQEGEFIGPDSIMQLPIEDDLPVFPKFERHALDPFLLDINSSGKK